MVLVRHAKAEAGEGSDDHDRRLTARGQADAAAAGQWLADNVPRPDRVWCSSAVRAHQTWTAAAASLPGAPAPERDRALYLAGTRDLLERIEGAAAGVTVVVGHNPTMEMALAALVGDQRGMKTGAVAVIDLGPPARLLDFWSPRH